MTVRELSGEQKEALHNTVDAMKLTPQEVNKFESAFKDPDFLRLFEEYAKEMEDPATKAETEAYLRQVESEGQFENVYGKGAQLVVPNPEFLIKTKVKGDSTKVFVNVCSSDKIDVPTSSEATSKDGVKGESWAIPLSLSAMRKGADKAGLACWVYDFTVHPDAVAKSLANQRFMDIVMDSAFERIEQATQSTLQRNYKKLSAKFKATASHDKPGVQAIRGEGGQVSDGRLKPNPDHSGLAGLPAKTASDAVTSKGATASKGSSFSFDRVRSHRAAQQSRKASDPGFKHPGGEVTPQYQIVESGDLDLGEAWSDKGLSTPAPCPRHLVLRVELPGVTSVSGVELEVAPQKVSLRVATRYRLDIDLRHRVRDTEGRAKFDKVKSKLEVTLPVVPPQRPAPLCTELPPADTALVQQLPDREPRSSGEERALSLDSPADQLCMPRPELEVPLPTAGESEDRVSDENASRQEGVVSPGSTHAAGAHVETLSGTVEVLSRDVDASAASAVARQWADVNRVRDEADQRAAAATVEQNASSVAAVDSRSMQSAGSMIAPAPSAPTSSNCTQYAADNCGLESAGSPAAVKTVMLAPALQLSFVEELD